MGHIQYWIILLVFFIFIGLVVLAVRASMKRIKARLKALRDFGFLPASLDPNSEQRILAVFARENAAQCKLRNVSKKEMPDYTLYSFDIVTLGNQRRAESRPALALVSPQVKAPFFALGSSTGTKGPGRIMTAVIDYLAAKAGMKKVVLEGRPDFNDFYVLIGADAQAVNGVFDGRLADWLVSLKEQPGMRGVSVAAENGLIVWAWTDTIIGDSDSAAHLKDAAERIRKLYAILQLSRN